MAIRRGRNWGDVGVNDVAATSFKVMHAVKAASTCSGSSPGLPTFYLQRAVLDVIETRR